MNFSELEEFHKKWKDILVIGKTIERDDKRYHIIGMTLSDEAKLYIIEPYIEIEHAPKKGVRNQRRLLKERDSMECCYLHCSEFYLGSERLEVQGGTGGPLAFSSGDYGVLQLFFDMMSAGWIIPEWLKAVDWDGLQLVTLDIAAMEKLPEYLPDMPVTIRHSLTFTEHIIEKPVTLRVGKSRSFSFTDADGETVQCYINSVTLFDVWKNCAEQLNSPQLAERFSPKQLKEAEKQSYEALKQCCPKGMCYTAIEYECSKDLSLTFYSRQFLTSRPEQHHGSSSFFVMRLKPDKETGTHGLPLKGCVIDTPVSPDTVKISAELFLYYEKVPEWTETV